MRFTRLVVESFQAIERAEIELGPGLNVLFGPNDLGKSTLATAMRAALLVPPSSSEAAAYAPWYADATPKVTLTFVDGSGAFWRVKKTFGSGAGATAELDHSKDGVTFTSDAKAREVEARLRALLGWGIPAPGGKGGPRGLPRSFLANALLATQADVETLLGESLANDDEASGKVRLSKALATLAQDPGVKKVLDTAQAEVDLCFTPTGRKKRGQGSKFTDASKRVTDLREELAALDRQVDESTGIEENVTALRAKRHEAELALGRAKAALEAAEARAARSSAEAEARAKLTEAEGRLASIDEEARRVEALARQLAAKKQRVAEAEETVGIAEREEAAATAEVSAADEALRRATSDDGARARELERARLAERRASLGSKKLETAARIAEVEAVIAARAEATSTSKAAEAARAEAARRAGLVEGARGRATTAAEAVEAARALIAFGRLRESEAAAEEAKRATLTAEKSREEATAREAEADALAAGATPRAAALASRAANLPTDDQAALLGRLERDLKLAEAALGGGLSVSIKPKAGVTVRAGLDERGLDEGAAAARVLEAERSVRLLVGDLVEIEINAGAVDKRRNLERLRERWQAAAVPALERAGLRSADEVTRALAEIGKERAVLASVTADVERKRAEAQNLRERAALFDEQAARAGAGAHDVEARRAALGGLDLAALGGRFEQLGAPWEARAESQRRLREGELRAASEALAAAEQDAAIAGHKRAESEERARERAAAFESSARALGGAGADELLSSLRATALELTREESESAAREAALFTQAAGLAEEAERAAESARERARLAAEARVVAASLLEEARAQLHAGSGELGALRSHLEALDRPAALVAVEARRAELAKLAGEPGGEADVAAAREALRLATHHLEELKEDLHKGEGALSRSGGPALREAAVELRAALAVATDREQALEVEAEAWKLLLDTLRAVENEEGAHLGRALAAPVGATLVELTGGRYDKLQLDAALRTEAVEAAGAGRHGPEVLDALSMGTRAQLATLIRLALAEHLGSALVLDDHLVHTDPTRLAWFRAALEKTAKRAQIVVLTCRPGDYLAEGEVPDGEGTRDVLGGTVRAIAVERYLRRWTR